MIYRDRILVDAPLAYWRLGDSGDAAMDASGNALDASIEGATKGVPGAIFGDDDTAIALDGVDDYVNLPEGFANLATGFTVEMWIRPTGLGVNETFLQLSSGVNQDAIRLASVGDGSELLFEVANDESSSGRVIAVDRA